MKRIAVIFLVLMVGIPAFAQVVNGVVRDESGVPLEGAAVTLEGSKEVGTVTDAKGAFSLKVPSVEKASIRISFISYKTAVISLNGKSEVQVVLEDDVRSLDESVVVGYGTMRKSDITGSVTSVKIDEDDAARSLSIDQLLQGNAAGVQVVNNSAAPDAGVSIRIRGLSSFNGGSDPLYVVDGIIINGESSSESLFSNGGLEGGTSEETNGLMGINPQDIASIEILKDASATAIYGSLGANGVVLITTKSANKEKLSVRFNAGVDVARANKRIDVLSFDEYVNYLKDMGCTAALSTIYENPSTNTGLKVTPMDWQDYMLRTAVSQRYYLSISGKPQSLSYMFSLGYNDSQGIVKNSGVRQITSRLNLEKDFSGKLKIGTKTSIAYFESEMVQGASASRLNAASSSMRSMLSYRPYMNETNDDIDDEEYDYASGPDKWLKYFTNTRAQLRITPNVYADWKIAPWISFKSTLGADYQNTSFTKFKSRQISRLVGSIGTRVGTDFFKYNWDNMFQLNKRFGSHNISGTVGMTVSSSQYSNQTVEAWFIDQDYAQGASIISGESPYTLLSYRETKSSLMSFLARFVYNYRDRYILTATYRLDGSSRFQGSNKWASFPSFAFAWRIDKERWYDVKWMNQAKVRLGWGMVGNQAVPEYRTIPLYYTTTVADHTESNASGTQVATYQGYIANPDLKWETTKQFNAGLDFSFLKNRITFTIDAYSKLTDDLLQSKNISRSTGYSTMWVNQGSILNNGFEFSLDAVAVKSRDFEWSIGGNFSLNRNKITNIGSDMQSGEIYLSEGNKQNCNYFWGSMLRSSSSNLAVLNIFIEGQPMGLFYGFKTLGVVQEGEIWPTIGNDKKKHAEAGDVKYVDLDGNGYIDDNDRTIIGNPNPVFTYGFNTRFRWRNLSLSMKFTGSYGNNIYNLNNYQDYNTYALTASSNIKNIRHEAYFDAWSADNTETKYPRLGYQDELFSDRFVQDGSYLRLSNLSLSYLFRFKQKDFFIKSINAGLSVGNVFVITSYDGWDPDVNSFGRDISRMGVDSGSYPAQRTFSFDLKFAF